MTCRLRSFGAKVVDQQGNCEDRIGRPDISCRNRPSRKVHSWPCSVARAMSRAHSLPPSSSSRLTRERANTLAKNQMCVARASRSSGQSMLESMRDGPSRRTVEPWCKVFHQLTEKCTIGTLTMPTRAKGRRPCRSTPILDRVVQADHAEEKKQQDQFRGQTRIPGRHVPHIGLPQIEPVASVTAVKKRPPARWSSPGFRKS